MRRSYLLFAGLLLVCIAFLSLGLVQEGAGKTITVDDDGGADYEKIQWAIENATEGDTIQVAEGTYYENVLVNKTLTLVGAGPEKTTIDASGDGDVVSITVDWCNVSGFKMTGSGNWDVAGLKIESHHNQIDNINSSDNDVRGIHLVLANHNSLTNISCYSNNEHGLYSHWSHHNTFTNVICVGNDNGAYFTGSDYNDLTNFQCTDNVDGLHLKSTDDNNLTQIECSSNDNGIYLDHSRGNSFSHIVCDSNSLNGMEFQDSDGNELLFGNFTSNTQNGIWIYHSEDIFISNVTSNSNDNGIGFEASNDNFFSGIQSSENNKGLYVYFSRRNVIEKSTCRNNEQYGIQLHRYSLDNKVQNTSCSGNGLAGIFLNSFSDRNLIENTVISDNKDGIYLEESCNNTEAHYNEIMDNSENGIDAMNNKFTVNATNNWFGHTTGPYHEVNNTEGKGDEVTDLVIFQPWSKTPRGYKAIKPKIESILPNPALVGKEIAFTGSVPGDRTIKRVVWKSGTSELYNGTETSLKLSDLPAGVHNISLLIQENGTEIWSEKAYTTLVIHQRPTVSIDSISPNPAIQGDEVSFSGEGEDDGSVVQYRWTSSLDGELYQGTEPSFSTSNLSIGSHIINLTVQDNRGVWSEEASLTLEVKEYVPPVNILPTVTITSPQDDAELSGTVTIKGSASDEDGTVEKVDISVDGEWFTVTGVTSWEFELDTTTLDNGQYVLKVLSYDGEDYSNDTLLSITVNNKDVQPEDAGFLPGFGLLGLVLGLVLVGYGRRYRKKTR